MTYHVAVGEVYDDEIVFVFVDGGNQFVFHFIRAHLGFEVVGGYFGRSDQYAFFTFVRGFTTAVEEECDMCVFLGFGNMQLCFLVVGKIFAQCVFYILFVEKDMYAGERGIVRSHAIVLQPGDGVHVGFGDVVLCEGDSEFFRTVVPVVEEYHYVAFLYASVYLAVYDRFDEFVGNPFVVRFLHGLYHVVGFFTDTVYQQVVSDFYPLPTFVAVHGIITSDDRCHFSCRLGAMGFQFCDESFTASRVGIASVHEAVDECVADAVFFGNIAQFEQVVERTVYAAIRGQPHQVYAFAMFFCVGVG